jgi:AraC-like DNA-binding protein
MPTGDPTRVSTADAVARGWARYFAVINALAARRRSPLAVRLEAARRFLDAHLDEPLTLDRIARQAHLSKFHFLRVFQAAYHDTPLGYLRRRRLDRARLLLTRTELPVTAVGLHVGFESLGSFSTRFRRDVGLSPSAYRRAYAVVPRTIRSAARQVPCCWLRRYAPVPPVAVRTPQS